MTATTSRTLLTYCLLFTTTLVLLHLAPSPLHLASAAPLPTPLGNVVAQLLNDPGPPPSCRPPPQNATIKTDVGIIIPIIVGSTQFFVPYNLAMIFPTLNTLVVSAWSALAAFHPTAQPLIPTGVPRSAPSLHTLQNRNVAMAHALLRCSELMFPQTMGPFVRSQLIAAGLDPDNKCTNTLANPACAGNVVGAAAWKSLLASGWNPLGKDKREFNGQPFEDYSGYVPKNTAYEFKDIYSWQPLLETDGQGYFWVQEHLSPFAALVKPALVQPCELSKRTVAFPFTLNKEGYIAAYKAQSDMVLAASAGLNDTSKMIAEHFNSAGYAFQAFLHYAQALEWNQTTAMSFLVFASLYQDAASLAIRAKIQYHTARPASWIRHLYDNSRVSAYVVSERGARNIKGKDWVSYLRTANDAEFPSGQVCLCTVFVEWMEKFVGTKNINLPYQFRKGCSAREPYVTPQADINGVFATTAQMLEACQQARVFGGMHFPFSSTGGNQLCSGLGYAGYARMQKLLKGA